MCRNPASLSPKVRLKIVYYQNRFVAVPVSPGSAPQSIIPVPSTSTTTMPSQQTTTGAVPLPSSVEVPLIAVSSSSSLPLSSPANQHRLLDSSYSTASTSSPRPTASRTASVDRPSPASPRPQRQLTATEKDSPRFVTRLVECLQDRDPDPVPNSTDIPSPVVDHVDERVLGHERTVRSGRSNGRGAGGGVEERGGASFDLLVKTINLCFLATGIILFVSVVVVIIYTTIGKSSTF